MSSKKGTKKMSDDLAFSKAKQLRDGLSVANDYAAAQIDQAAKLSKLKKLARQTSGVTMGTSKSGNHVSVFGAIEFPDKRYYMRSTWERNYARYLQFLQDQKIISFWYYEPQRFDFPVKRGNNSYLPDFKVINNDGTIEYHEVKGYMNQGSRTKMKRFMKYYPDKKLVLIDKYAYKQIKDQCKNLIKGWE